jgi:hypothetical protein
VKWAQMIETGSWAKRLRSRIYFISVFLVDLECCLGSQDSNAAK